MQIYIAELIVLNHEGLKLLPITMFSYLNGPGNHFDRYWCNCSFMKMYGPNFEFSNFDANCKQQGVKEKIRNSLQYLSFRTNNAERSCINIDIEL